jgi:hypothetical protein
MVPVVAVLPAAPAPARLRVSTRRRLRRFGLALASASALLAVAAAQAPARPARAYVLRALPDGTLVRWRREAVEWRIDPRLLGEPARGRAAFEAALDAWRGIGGLPDLRLSAAAPEAEPGAAGAGLREHGVYVVDDWPHGDALAVTLSTHLPDGTIVDADILVRADADLDVLAEDGAAPGRRGRAPFDAVSLLVHELGHALGLGESADPEAVMWPSLRRGDVRGRRLGADDDAAIDRLYGVHPRLVVASCSVAR